MRLTDASPFRDVHPLVAKLARSPPVRFRPWSLPHRQSARPTSWRPQLASYTLQLIELLDVFGKLDKAAARRMAANERYLMARACFACPQRSIS
jgi:hypothetical protein